VSSRPCLSLCVSHSLSHPIPVCPSVSLTVCLITSMFPTVCLSVLCSTLSDYSITNFRSPGQPYLIFSLIHSYVFGLVFCGVCVCVFVCMRVYVSVRYI